MDLEHQAAVMSGICGGDGEESRGATMTRRFLTWTTGWLETLFPAVTRRAGGAGVESGRWRALF